jgi:hypothetical protein
MPPASTIAGNLFFTVFLPDQMPQGMAAAAVGFPGISRSTQFPADVCLGAHSAIALFASWVLLVSLSTTGRLNQSGHIRCQHDENVIQASFSRTGGNSKLIIS